MGWKAGSRVEKISNWEGEGNTELSKKYLVKEFYRLFSKLKIQITTELTITKLIYWFLSSGIISP
jgi:hypothetical protein